jgi:hypothetical protein
VLEAELGAIPVVYLDGIGMLLFQNDLGCGLLNLPTVASRCRGTENNSACQCD